MNGKIVAAVCAVVVVAGCGASGGAHPAGGGAASPAAAVQTEGSVAKGDSSVRYPDGVTIRLTDVSILPRDYGESVPNDDSVVRVTVHIENRSTAAVPLDNPQLPIWLTYGPNRANADQDSGGAAGGGNVNSEIPQQVGAGQTLELFFSFDVPTVDLDVLTVTVNLRPGHYTPFTFTDAQTLIGHGTPPSVAPSQP